MKKFTNKKGFTLLELIIVIAIIAAIVSIAVPLMINHSNRAKETARESNAKTIYEVSGMIFTDEPELKDLAQILCGYNGSESNIPVFYIGSESNIKLKSLNEPPENYAEGTDGGKLQKILKNGFESYGIETGSWPDKDLHLGIECAFNGDVKIYITYKDDNVYYPKS